MSFRLGIDTGGAYTDAVLKSHGLLLLGSMQVSKEDGVPDVAESRPARQLLLIGNGGSSFWPSSLFLPYGTFMDSGE